MPRFAARSVIVLVCLALTSVGCDSSREPDEAPVVQRPQKGDQDKIKPGNGKTGTEVVSPKGGDVEGSAAMARARKTLIGSWNTRFVVDDTALAAFVEDNMLTDELAEAERKRWNESTIFIVFNADGTFSMTEPDGNLLAGYWKIASASDGVRVVLTSAQQVHTLLIQMDESGDAFSSEFLDSQYEMLPIRSPFQFSRD